MSRARSCRAPQLFALCAFLAVSAPLAARAEPSSQDKAESHALFERAMGEYKQGHYDRALPLFQSSQQLDAGVGALMYMAECHRQLGQTASAWGAFKEAATIAVKLGDKRDKLALEKAAEIEKSLSYLSVELPAAARVDGLQIKRDGRALPTALLGVATPIDPGEHTLEISAPGRQTQTHKVPVGTASARVVFTIKPLDAELTVGKPAAAKPSAPAGPTPPVPGEGAPSRPAEPTPAPGPWRTVGFAAGGVGLATGIVGGIVAIRAVGKAGDAKTVAEHEEQRGPYTTGLVVAGVGGALLVTGAALVLTHPNPTSAAARLQIAPTVGQGVSGLTASGVW